MVKVATTELKRETDTGFSKSTISKSRSHRNGYVAYLSREMGKHQRSRLNFCTKILTFLDCILVNLPTYMQNMEQLAQHLYNMKI